MNSPEASAIYRRCEGVSVSRFGSEGLVVVPKQAMQLVLNEIGARTMELVDGRRSVEDIAREIAGEYADAPPAEELLGDVREVLADLAQNGAVEAS